MYRKGQRVRFFDRAANQVGPEHGHVVPAVTWAYANGWTDTLTANSGVTKEER